MQKICNWLEQSSECKRTRPIRFEIWDKVGRIDWAIIPKVPCSVKLKFKRQANDWFVKIVFNNGYVAVNPTMEQGTINAVPGTLNCVMMVEVT